MLKRLLAASALSALAGCVVGPGYGYYDQGYGAAPVYGAQPAYGYAPAYGVGQVDIAVSGHRDGHDNREYHDYHDGQPRADWHGQRDDGGARSAQARGYGGQRPQPGQAAPAANGGRDPNWHGGNPGAGGGGASAQGHQGGGSRQDAGGSGSRANWQGNNGNNGNNNARW
jgi:hypothetical protein